MPVFADLAAAKAEMHLLLRKNMTTAKQRSSSRKKLKMGSGKLQWISLNSWRILAGTRSTLEFCQKARS